MLGSIQGDRTLDKSIPFYEKLEDLFNYLFQEQHWCEARTFTIGSPFKAYTKTKLLEKYLAEGHDINLILKSYSCYEGGEKHCGACKPCFRKWVALENNGVSTDDYWINNPKEVEWLEEVLPLIKEKKWRGDEDEDILKALGI